MGTGGVKLTTHHRIVPRSRSRFSIPGRDNNFSLFHNVQIVSGAHPGSYTMGTGGCFSGVKSGRVVKLTTHIYLAPRLKMVELYLRSLIGLHRLVFN
jgi:hypothetical protein